MRRLHVTHPLALIGWVALAEGAGAFGSLFTAPAIQGWYATLTKPDLTPPSWVFAPVWSTLFLFMGIAAYLVWQRRHVSHVRTSFVFFGVQLALNVLWSFLFFGLQNPAFALLDIAFLWVAIFGTIVAFAKVSRSAAWLLAPYLAWVSFAAYLNYLLWALNS